MAEPLTGTVAKDGGIAPVLQHQVEIAAAGAVAAPPALVHPPLIADLGDPPGVDDARDPGLVRLHPGAAREPDLSNMCSHERTVANPGKVGP